MQDRLLGFGECFSARLISEALCEAGLKATHVDARECIVTDARHGQARPLWDVTNQRIQEVLTPLLEGGRIPVLGGFIASTVDGVPTTLGRGGSDFSAAILGAALRASRVEIWTDVDGVMTADPKICPEARVIPKMSFDEAADLAHFGAKVLHPATLAPAMRENIPVYVLNSRRPDGTGTEITARPRGSHSVSAITAKRNVAAVEIESLDGIESALLDAVFAAFERHACSVDVMSTSMGRMSLLVGSTSALPKIAEELRDSRRFGGRVTALWFAWWEKIFAGSRKWQAKYSRQCPISTYACCVRDLPTGRSLSSWMNRGLRKQCNGCTVFFSRRQIPVATGEESPAAFCQAG